MQNMVRKGGDAGDGCKCKKQKGEQEPGRAPLVPGGGLGDAECLKEDGSQGFEQMHESMLQEQGLAMRGRRVDGGRDDGIPGGAGASNPTVG